jgi:hypothetical protein
MRHALLLSLALLVLLAAAAFSCGGSSSETPWPVEPEASQLLGPSGESAGPSSIIEERPDAGGHQAP